MKRKQLGALEVSFNPIANRQVGISVQTPTGTVSTTVPASASPAQVSAALQSAASANVPQAGVMSSAMKLAALRSQLQSVGGSAAMTARPAPPNPPQPQLDVVANATMPTNTQVAQQMYDDGSGLPSSAGKWSTSQKVMAGLAGAAGFGALIVLVKKFR